MPKSFDQMSQPPGKNPYGVELTQTSRPDGSEQVNLASDGSKVQLNRDASGNMTVTRKGELSPSDIMPFVSMQPLAGAMDTIFGTRMAGSMPSQAQLMQQYNQMQQAPLDREMMKQKIESYGKLTPFQEEQLRLRAQESELRKEELEDRRKEREANRTLREKEAEDKAALRLSQAEEKRARTQQIADKKVERYSDKIKKSGIPVLKTIMTDISGILSKYEDIPGQGKGSMLPDFYYEVKGGDESRDALSLRANIQKLFNMDLKERSGAAVTATELARLKKEYQSGKLNSDVSMRKALDRMRRAMLADVRNMGAGLGTETVEAYKESPFGEDFKGEFEKMTFSPGVGNQMSGLTPEEERELAELEALEASQAGK